ncbi:uncharacterized protein EV154DRAFT_527408 [Mucor mucedo]|uniref:uncharacterized protein n=1 Tax=Mucor mucedo TaxID=29922 RepID=UPI0022205D22|nr:uncharacterized protein EV154DRAFT_527408 [Mucor mucedo]KAI7874180.1 hypothetical protein EV154DRAFT_527408 [Mucor mucedo]
MSFKKDRLDGQLQQPETFTIPNNNNRDKILRPLKPVIENKELSTVGEPSITQQPPDLVVPQSQSYQSLPTQRQSNVSFINTSSNNSTNRKGRRVLNRFESAPQEGWKLIKKWVGNNRQQKEISKQQQTISLERQAEINTITPIIMAMFFIKDEEDKKRIPVFLNNMTVKVSKLEESDDDYFNSKRKKFRGTIFRITVHYGTGPGKITWSVYRRYWDFVKLHYRYKKKYSTSTPNGTNTMHSRVGLPKFPSLPRHHFRKQRKRDYESRVPMSRLPTTTSQNSTGRDPVNQGDSVMDEEAVMALMQPEDILQHQASTPSEVDPSIISSQVMEVVKADTTVLKAMELYLNQFIASIEPSGYINRLCKFLEISALGIHLAAKYPITSFHGKEGFAVFQSRTDRDPKHSRKFLQDGFVCSFPTTGGRRRRKPKWIIVRESYVICVDDPSECEIYDVFLFDQAFDVHRLAKFGDRSNHHVHNSKKKFSNALANASHWTSKKSTVCLKTMQGVYHFRAKNEQQAKQFEASIQSMANRSVWPKVNRFKSFAPIRCNAAVAWFVDGRDYFWDVSVALENATESIYIHDWWLSPELFLRRPAAQNLEWRLDRLLRRKADQGVKVYIVMYKEVAMALPLFSHQAKRHLLSLSPNIFVQRHPSRALDIFNKNSIFFWAHHEKICVVDNEVAFIGGLDQCFGRYDTPGHTLIDDFDPELVSTNENPQVWPGKDYSNPRIIDFHTLDKPFEDNMDRSTLPRMPWHDVSMRLVGQPVRDISRHFVQRWNFLRRKKPSAPKRPTPMLLPVPDSYNKHLGIDDPRICHPHTSESCRVQILRSVSPWSIGSIDHVEHSIQTAYVESIHDSKYLIYIENQFFVTSTKSGSTVIENKIGDAIYNRILRAHQLGEAWRAILIVPLVPGFTANVDETEGTTVRIIMQLQYLSVSRGPDSLIGRLHAAGITNTHEYINFYGLRNWGELNGQFVTEQVYIHAKTIIVDDCKVIIGSANINERSQLGTRDSEIAACIEDDTDLIDSFFNGVPVKVGRYAHTLRMRLMCEHIGLDVDRADREKYSQNVANEQRYMKEPAWHNYGNRDKDKVDCIPPYIEVTATDQKKSVEKSKIQQEEKDEVSMSELKMSNTGGTSDSSDTASQTSSNKGIFHGIKHFAKELHSDKNHPSQRKDTLSPTSSTNNDHLTIQPVNSNDSNSQSANLLSPTKSIFSKRKSTKEDYVEFWTSLDCDTDNNGDVKYSQEELEEKNAAFNYPGYYNSATTEPLVMGDKTVGEVYRILQDPLTQEFQEFWHMLARVNTDLFRRSFLVTPDNNVRTWDQYHHYIKMAKLFLGRTDPKHGGTKTTSAAANVTALPLENMAVDTIADILKHIRGHLVIWPMHFMEEDDNNNEFLFHVDKIVPGEIFD